MFAMLYTYSYLTQGPPGDPGAIGDPGQDGVQVNPATSTHDDFLFN